MIKIRVFEHVAEDGEWVTEPHIILLSLPPGRIFIKYLIESSLEALPRGVT